MVDTKIDYNMILRRYDAEAENNDSPEAIAAKMLPADEDLREVASAVLYMKFPQSPQHSRFTSLSTSSTRDSLQEWRSFLSCTHSTSTTCLRS